jgi:hypothetical protein
MALPGSGTISMGAIQTELGIGEGDPGFSNFGLSEARNGTYVAINACSTYKPPSSGTISLSDWWGYNHTQACPPAYDIYLMAEYGCDGIYCVDNGLEAYGAFTVGFSPNYTRYYATTSFTGVAYKVVTIFPSGSPAILMSSTPYVSCPTAAGCGV